MLEEFEAMIDEAENKLIEAELAIRVLKGAGENVTAQNLALRKAKAKVEKLKDSMKKVKGG